MEDVDQDEGMGGHLAQVQSGGNSYNNLPEPASRQAQLPTHVLTEEDEKPRGRDVKEPKVRGKHVVIQGDSPEAPKKKKQRPMTADEKALKKKSDGK